MKWVNSIDTANYASLNLSRETVESMDVTRVAANLARLTESAESVRKFQDQLLVTVDGYNDDPRELWFITEVRDYLTALDAQFPFWLHFCEKKGGTLEMIALCLTPLTQGDGALAARTAADHNSFMDKHLEAAAELYRRYDLPAETTRKLMTSVGNYYRERLNWYPRLQG